MELYGRYWESLGRGVGSLGIINLLILSFILRLGFQ